MLHYPMLWAASLDFGDRLPWIKEVASRAGSVPFTDVILPSLTTHLMSKEYTNSLMRGALRNEPRSIAEILYLLGAGTLNEEKLAWVMPYLPRCQRFFIKFKKHLWFHIRENVSQPSPYLHTFSIIIQGSQQTDKDFTLPKDIFAHQAPQLRVLDIRGCGCHFSSPVFRNLTTLIVRKPSSSYIPTAISWLEILGNMKDLHTLVLTSAFAPPQQGENDSDIESHRDVPMVTLPHLKSLSLLGNSESCSILLTHLDFNFETFSVIDIKCYRIRLDTFFNSMISYLQHHLRLPQTELRQSSLTVLCTPTGLGFTKRSLEGGELCNSRVISLNWFASYADPNIMAIFPSFLSILKDASSEVPQLRLDFNHSDALYDSCIVEILVIFPKVERLYITMDYSLQRLLPVLNSQNTLNQSSLLSSLRTIVLEHALFEESNDIEDLFDFVRKRFLTESAIQSIAFVQCGNVSDISVVLKRLGVNVIIPTEELDSL